VRVKSVNMGKGIVLLKVILECGHLEDKLKKLACKIVEDAGADFVENSTGWADAPATLYDVELLRDALPESIGVKASGGIDSAEVAEAMIAAGAGRIGTANAVAIVSGFAKLRQVS
jgi:deoxyribose-phosphate aldolase